VTSYTTLGSKTVAVRVAGGAISSRLGVGSLIAVEVLPETRIVVQCIDMADLADIVIGNTIPRIYKFGLVSELQWIKVSDLPYDARRILTGHIWVIVWPRVIRVDILDLGLGGFRPRPIRIKKNPNIFAVGGSPVIVLVLAVWVMAGPAVEIPVAVIGTCGAA